jgi:hypothetical protein
MNTQLVNSLIQIIFSLSKEERNLLEEKLFFDISEPSIEELMKLAEKSGSFSFLEDEPNIYTLEDGEPV